VLGADSVFATALLNTGWLLIRGALKKWRDANIKEKKMVISWPRGDLYLEMWLSRIAPLLTLWRLAPWAVRVGWWSEAETGDASEARRLDGGFGL